jgi:hypothetical protein
LRALASSKSVWLATIGLLGDSIGLPGDAFKLLGVKGRNFVADGVSSMGEHMDIVPGEPFIGDGSKGDEFAVVEGD